MFVEKFLFVTLKYIYFAVKFIKVQWRQEKKCRFCSLPQIQPQLILYEDDKYYVIEDIKQATSKWHILICPKQHISDIYSLNHHSIEMIDEMKEILERSLNERFDKTKHQYRIGFHRPPFISQFHLHMHGFVLPFENSFYDKIGYGKFMMPIDTLKKLLQKPKTA